MTTLKPEAVAQELDLHIDTVKRMCRTGQLPGAKKVGGVWRIVRRPYEDWLLSDASVTLPETDSEGRW